MSQQIEELKDLDLEQVVKHREWIVGHFNDSGDYDTASGKLQVIDTILNNNWIEPHETWKLQSLGIAFGDALVQEVPELFWVVVEDEFGRDPALRWLQTTVLSFPLTAISKRVEDGISIDIYELFGEFQKAINLAVANRGN